MRRQAPFARDRVQLPAGPLPRNKGLRYRPDPPTVEEIIAVMCATGDDPDGVRLRGVIVVLWRGAVVNRPAGVV